MGDRHFYASDSYDNHEAPWTPMDADNARDAAIEYAWTNGMEPDPTGEWGEDRVYVIEASEDDEIPDGWDKEAQGRPLTVYGRWCYRLVAEVPGGFEVEEVSDG